MGRWHRHFCTATILVLGAAAAFLGEPLHAQPDTRLLAAAQSYEINSTTLPRVSQTFATATTIQWSRPGVGSDFCRKVALHGSVRAIPEATLLAERDRAYALVQQAYSDPRYLPLLAYAQSELTSLRPPSGQGECTGHRALVFDDDAAVYLQRLAQLLREIASLAHQNVTVVIESIPPGATATLRALIGDPNGETQGTLATFPNRARGRFLYEVKLNGYMPAIGDLNLAKSTDGHVRCALVPAAAPSNLSTAVVPGPLNGSPMTTSCTVSAN